MLFRSVSEPLARANPQMTVEAFLKVAEERSGLLLEQTAGVYSFAHLTFQEYLAAVHIKEQGLGLELPSRVSDVWWYETIRLYGAQTDATAIILACLAAAPPGAGALSLALECQEETQEGEQPVRAQVQAMLEESLENEDPERRRVGAEVLLTRRLRRQMSRLGENRFMTTSLVTCAEYQLFLDELRQDDTRSRPDHWMAGCFPPGQGLEPALGVRFSAAVAFCEWLTARESGPWRYRLPLGGEQAPEQREQHQAQGWSRGVGYWSMGGFKYLGERQARRWLTDEIVANQMVEDRALASTHIRARILDLARTRDSVLDLDLARACVLKRSPARDNARARDLVRALTHALNFARLLGVDHARAFDRALTGARALNKAITRAHDSISTSPLDKALARALIKMQTEEEAMQVLRWLIRLAALVMAEVLLEPEIPTADQRKRRHFPMFGKAKQAAEVSLRVTVNAYLDLYVDYAILEARIKGILRPCEGILLVKERATIQEKQAYLQQRRSNSRRRGGVEP